MGQATANDERVGSYYMSKVSGPLKMITTGQRVKQNTEQGLSPLEQGSRGMVVGTLLNVNEMCR